jgi:hypothetical protein
MAGSLNDHYESGNSAEGILWGVLSVCYCIIRALLYSWETIHPVIRQILFPRFVSSLYSLDFDVSFYAAIVKNIRTVQLRHGRGATGLQQEDVASSPILGLGQVTCHHRQSTASLKSGLWCMQHWVQPPKLCFTWGRCNFFFCGTRVWTQDLTFARQTLYHWDISTSPILWWYFFSFFEEGSWELFAWDWFQTQILLISASWVTRIIAVSYQWPNKFICWTSNSYVTVFGDRVFRR